MGSSSLEKIAEIADVQSLSIASEKGDEELLDARITGIADEEMPANATYAGMLHHKITLMK
jgi:hypothetical protein